MTREPKPTGKLWQLARRMVMISVTLATVAGAGVAVVMGSEWLQARANAAGPAASSDLIPVAVDRIVMQDGFTVPRRFVGQVETTQSTDLSFEFAGRVAEVLVDEGDVVTKGAPVARLDTALLDTEITRLMAAREALRAQLAFSERSVARRQALNQRGFASEEAFDQARFTSAELTARISETTAAIRNAEIRIEKSTLRAPFDGRVAARRSDTGATVGMGAAIVTLLETAEPRVRVGLPVDLDIGPDTPVMVTVSGQDYPARLVTLRPDIDPATRTRTAIFSIDGDQLAYGQSATVRFDRHVAAAGAWVPVRALREGTQGLWTVLIVDDEDHVRPAAVEVIYSDADRAYVRGSFAEGARLIQAGPHRVTPGQTVRVIGGA